MASMRGLIWMPPTQLGVDLNQYDKATDVMDVWFDSGVVHHCLSVDSAGNHLAKRFVSGRFGSAPRLVPQSRC